jgi:Flp pilus assembly protein TadG
MALPPLAPATAIAPRRPLGRRRGAAAVEFAMVAPVALLMILGSIEFGRAMFVHMLAVNTAHDQRRGPAQQLGHQ